MGYCSKGLHVTELARRHTFGHPEDKGAMGGSDGGMWTACPTYADGVVARDNGATHDGCAELEASGRISAALEATRVGERNTDEREKCREHLYACGRVCGS